MSDVLETPGAKFNAEDDIGIYIGGKKKPNVVQSRKIVTMLARIQLDIDIGEMEEY